MEAAIVEFLKALSQKTSLFTWQEAVFVIGVIWTIAYIASLIAKKTPNKTDDTFAGRFRSIMRVLGRAVGADPPVEDVDKKE